MKVIEKGTVVTSPYFGNGYVVRTLLDLNTNKQYVVVRVIKDRDIVFCTFPQSVNRLFYLPDDFDQNVSPASLGLIWPDDFSDLYNEKHHYMRVCLSWGECFKRPLPTAAPVNKILAPVKPGKPSMKESSSSISTKARKSTVAATSLPLPEPINKPLVSLDAFAQMKYELYIPDKRTAVPPEELSAICDKDAPPPSYDLWDMWAENLDRD